MQPIRKHLLDLLAADNAHAGFDAAVKNVPVAIRGKRPKGSAHSLWEVLEHLRIAQWDILEFTRDPKHVSPEFPDGYWPKSPEPPDARAWNRSIAAFRSDHQAMMDLVADESFDLLTPLPHGSGQTVMREALVLADHNAYHLGQFMLLRRMLGS
jgi:hypothetical protein